MSNLINKIKRQSLAFICDQYIVLFFILTTGIKLALFNKLIIKVTWPLPQYLFGVICGFISVALLFSPLYFAKRHKNKLAILLALLITFIIVIDTVYFSYFSTLPGIGILNSLNEAKDVGPAIASMLNWWLLLYFVDILFSIVILKFSKLFLERFKTKYNVIKCSLKTSILITAVTLIALGVAIIPAYGTNNLNKFMGRGLETRPTAQYYGLLIAHAVDITRFVIQETVQISPEQKSEILNWVKNNKPSQEASPLNGIAKGKNIIMIQVESLGGFAINQYVNNREVTPNLDKLAQNSQFFPNERFVIAAGHTSDTDFVANSSYFPLTDSSVFIRFGQSDFTGLPKLLIENGYSTFAYHGYNRGFWGRDVALSSLGYQKFYGAESYPKGEKINMGLNDGDFLDKTADYINEQPKPSLSFAITLSSHVPFDTNNQTQELGININNYPNQVGGYLEDINYTDRMLGKFFEKLKSYGLYDDSLILVYGDHTPVLPTFSAGTINYDPTTIQFEEVPLIIKLPNETVGKTYPNQGNHLDIMPTILDLTGIKTSQLMFGKSLFASDSSSFQSCPDQIYTFSKLGDCSTTLMEEKNISSDIIRYNLFNDLPK